jgi:type I restriction enzyme S subunit
MSEWKQTTIGELCDAGLVQLQTGPFGSQLHAHDYVVAGVAVIPTEAIRDRQIDHSVLPKITLSKAKELERHKLRKDDILFARRGVQATGHIGCIREAEDGFICGTGAIRLRITAGEVISADFISHVLANPASVAWFKFHAIGATMPNLNETIIRSFPFKMPPPNKQRAIALLLSAFDDKIDLNRRMNGTLEAMARAIFKDWFVDFGPTRAKMERRMPYLSPEIWALFPDRLDDEGQPEGWEQAELGNVTSELRRGISPTYVKSGGVRVLNQKCVRNRHIDFSPSRRHDPSSRVVDGRELKIGDILVNSTGVGTLGRTAQLWEIGEPTVVDSHVTVIRADQANVSVCYLGLNVTGRETEIEALGEGSTGQTELARARLAVLPLLLPPKSVQCAFDKFAHPLLARMSINNEENLTLAATRDLLLPKLMSGEIQLRDAEKVLEAVA